MSEMDRKLRVESLLAGHWNESILFSLALTGHVLRIAFESFVGVAMLRLRLLVHMYVEGELSQADLQQRLEVNGATVTRQVKQLEAEGLLQRRVDPEDNRFTLVLLTPAGEAAVETLMKRGQQFLQLTIQNITGEELAATAAVLAQMRCNLQGLVSVDQCPQEHEGDVKA